MSPILTRVIRLLILMLCALGLGFVPVTANAAGSPSTGMPGCTMDGNHMPDIPADHSKMGCCTPACQAPSSAALLPNRDAVLATGFGATLKLAMAPVEELASASGSGLDPPPRA